MWRKKNWKVISRIEYIATTQKDKYEIPISGNELQ